ncbi:DNA-binding NarL/FixJ family response regulator [Paraburkholderia sp. WC7.3g]|uniref:Response regulatory domain-containing protein n=1 Tax=Paraburkholderia podalyriae TaxID=1938811 RepID=A0ABR7PPE7_9BURK|nr:hypothetical protein [Paraburkholderia podalyriae]MBC8748148.1 hypothetical protein [Paraburkholderia podalyriae]
MSHARTVSVVLIEDDDGHATLVRRNLREIARCYELGCNVYICKPVEYEAFIEAVRRLGLFLQVVKLPPGHRLASP